jgi:hypothetical protein
MMTMICRQLAVLGTMRTINQPDKWRKFKLGLEPFQARLTHTARDEAFPQTNIEVCTDISFYAYCLGVTLNLETRNGLGFGSIIGR